VIGGWRDENDEGKGMPEISRILSGAKHTPSHVTMEERTARNKKKEKKEKRVVDDEMRPSRSQQGCPFKALLGYEPRLFTEH